MRENEFENINIVTDLDGYIISSSSNMFENDKRFISYLQKESRDEFINYYPFIKPQIFKVRFDSAPKKEVFICVEAIDRVDSRISIIVLSKAINNFINQRDKILTLNANFNDTYFMINSREKTLTIMYTNQKEDKVVSFQDIIDPKTNYFDVALSFLPQLKKFLCEISKEPYQSVNLKIRGTNEQYLWYLFEIRSYQANRFIGRLINIDEAIKEREHIVKMSFLDPLTKVFQKEAIESQIKASISNNEFDNALFIILDIDYFKDVNDTHGHLFGDKVIKKTAEILKRIVEPEGKVGRIGGDEFLLFVPDIASEEIPSFARKINYALDNMIIDEQDFSCSATIGITQYPFDGNDFKTLFVKSDKALYRGKVKGRSCYIIYNDSLHGKLNSNGMFLEDSTATTVSRRDSINFLNGILDKLFLNKTKTDDEFLEILKIITEYYNLDRTIVYKSDGTIAFEYCNELKDVPLKRLKSINFKEYIKAFNKDNIIYFNDIILLKNKNLALYKFLSLQDIISAAQILLTKNDVVFGAVSFEMTLERRVWRNEEILDFLMLAKIINVFLSVKE